MNKNTLIAFTIVAVIIGVIVSIIPVSYVNSASFNISTLKYYNFYSVRAGFMSTVHVSWHSDEEVLVSITYLNMWNSFNNSLQKGNLTLLSYGAGFTGSFGYNLKDGQTYAFLFYPVTGNGSFSISYSITLTDYFGYFNYGMIIIFVSILVGMYLIIHEKYKSYKDKKKRDKNIKKIEKWFEKNI